MRALVGPRRWKTSQSQPGRGAVLNWQRVCPAHQPPDAPRPQGCSCRERPSGPGTGCRREAGGGPCGSLQLISKTQGPSEASGLQEMGSCSPGEGGCVWSGPSPRAS